MKLIDILLEGNLDIYRTQQRLSLNAQDHNAQAVIDLKQALAQHTLVTSVNPLRTAGRAWTGPIDGTWTPALDNAIIQWKESINRQIGRPLLAISPSIQGANDVDYLLYKRRFTDGSKAGLLKINNRGEIDSESRQAPSFSNRVYQHGKLGDIEREDVVDTRTFIEAIGFSGWMIILNHLAMEKYEDPADREQEIKRMMPVVESSYQLFPDKWRNRWVQEVVRSQRQATATLGTGETMSFVPPAVSGGPETAAKTLYDYFSKMAVGLFQLEEQQRQQQDAQVSSRNTNQPEMNAAGHAAWATNMHNALENNFIAIFTSRDVDNDSESVSQLFNQLRTAADYDACAAEYEKQFGEKLDERLVEELDDDQYARIVKLSLEAIQRIAPLAMLGAINFGDEQNSIQVEHQNQTYTIERQPVANSAVVKLGNQPVKNVILQDAILKVGINQTGGTVPDLNVEVTPESLDQAKILFVTALDENYPEMVAWYTNQTPFDEIVSVPFGDKMALAKVDRGARYIQTGMNDASVISWFTQEIKKDRDFLIGTEEEPESAAVNIYFDPKYKDEGARGRNGNFSTSLGDEAEENLTDEEIDLVDRLYTNNEEEFDAAIDDLISQPNAASEMESIYRVFEARHGEPFDTVIGGEEAVQSVLEGSDLDSESPINKLLSTNGITLALIASDTMGKMFKDSIDGWQSSNDRTRMQQLIAQITNRKDYDLVNETYQIHGGSEDLLEDLYEEENTVATGFGWFDNSLAKQLAAKIGREDALEIRRSGLPVEVIDSLSDLQEEPTLQNAKTLRTRVSRISDLDRNQVQIILQGIQNITEDFGPEVEQDVKDEINEFVNEIADIVREKDTEWYDRWFYDRWWQNIKGWFD